METPTVSEVKARLNSLQRYCTSLYPIIKVRLCIKEDNWTFIINGAGINNIHGNDILGKEEFELSWELGLNLTDLATSLVNSVK